MPIIHDNWDVLKTKLQESDKWCVNRQHIKGYDTTVVIEIEDEEYDPNIPIISESKFNRWFERFNDKCRNNPPSRNGSFASLTDSEPKVLVPSPPKSRIPKPIPKSLPKPAPKPVPKPLPKPVTKSTIKPKSSSQTANLESATKPPPKHSPTKLPKKPDSKPTTTKPALKPKPLDITSATSAPASKLGPSPAPSRSSSIADITAQTRPSCEKKKVKSRPKKRRLELEPDSDPEPRTTISDAQTSPVNGVNLSEDDSESVASCSTDDSARTTGYMKCSVDELIVIEPIDDEFAKYKDDDFDETLYQKNLKKIKSVPPPPKPTPVRIETPPPPSPPVAEKPKTPPKPVEPDWEDTEKQIREKKWFIALRDFEFFKDKIRETGDEQAIRILKEAIELVVKTDESVILIGFLDVCFHINLRDGDFFSDLIKRVKARLSTYERIKVFRNASNIGPQLILENYILAMTNLKQYLVDQDVTLTLPSTYLKFIYEPKVFFSNLFETARIENKKIPEPDSIEAGKINEAIESAGLDETTTNPAETMVNSNGTLASSAETTSDTKKVPNLNEGVTTSNDGMPAPPKCKVEPDIIPIPPDVVNQFKILLPDIKPVIKKEEKENQSRENEMIILNDILPRVPARKVTYKVDAEGKPDTKVFKIQSRGKRAAFKLRL